MSFEIVAGSYGEIPDDNGGYVSVDKATYDRFIAENPDFEEGEADEDDTDNADIEDKDGINGDKEGVDAGHQAIKPQEGEGGGVNDQAVTNPPIIPETSVAAVQVKPEIQAVHDSAELGEEEGEEEWEEEEEEGEEEGTNEESCGKELKADIQPKDEPETISCHQTGGLKDILTIVEVNLADDQFEGAEEQEASFGSSDEDEEEVQEEYEETDDTKYKDNDDAKATNESLMNLGKLLGILPTTSIGQTNLNPKMLFHASSTDFLQATTLGPTSSQGLIMNSMVLADKPRGYVEPDFSEELPRLEEILPSMILKANQKTDFDKLAEGSAFEDESFTEQSNLESSLSDKWAHKKQIEWSTMAWKRAKDIAGVVPRMFDKIDPRIIKQGVLGNCYFISALCSVAYRPAFIRRIIDCQEFRGHGGHKIWLNISGKWRQVEVDDRFPVDKEYEDLIMGRSEDGHLWVSYIEKAYAKAFGSYQALDGGNEVEALRDLTGAPYEVIDGDHLTNVDATWRKIATSNNKGYAMVCSILPDSNEEIDPPAEEVKRTDGLFEGHAYSLLACCIVPDKDGRLHRLLQIRNPWGSGDGHEWNGKWSDDSDLWTPEAKSLVAHSATEDGLFWMSVEDFCSIFTSLGICKMHAYFYHCSIDLSFDSQADSEQRTALIEVTTAGKYYFCVDQKDLRLRSLDDCYNNMRLLVAKVTESEFRFIGCDYGPKKLLSVKCKLNPGRYVVLLDVHAGIGDHIELCLSSYGADMVGMAECPVESASRLMMEHLVWRNWSGREQHAWQKMLGDPSCIESNGKLVVLDRHLANKQDEWGLKVVKHTPTRESATCLTSSLVLPDGSTVDLGSFSNEIITFKYGYKGQYSKVVFHAGQQATSYVGNAVIYLCKSLLAKTVPIDSCQLPPGKNPFLKKKAKPSMADLV